ncbi:MAG: putative transposase [Bryobacterales bacterium]|nr:putative transposase [Bryobacterales bacterium]
MQRWVVYAKPAFGAPTLVLRYLGRYTHRVAISNHRLLAFDGEHVTFRWKDYAHGNKQKRMTLEATEFLRRFTQHILPWGFVRIRQFGFLPNTRCSTLLALSRKLLATTPKQAEACPTGTAKGCTWQCPHCHGEMRIGPNLSTRQLASCCRPLDSS